MDHVRSWWKCSNDSSLNERRSFHVFHRAPTGHSPEYSVSEIIICLPEMRVDCSTIEHMKHDIINWVARLLLVIGTCDTFEPSKATRNYKRRNSSEIHAPHIATKIPHLSCAQKMPTFSVSFYYHLFLSHMYRQSGFGWKTLRKMSKIMIKQK